MSQKIIRGLSALFRMSIPLFLFACGLWLLACAPLAPVGQPADFTLVEATAQEWLAGVPGGSNGTNYRFTLKMNTAAGIAFDSVWVAGKRLKLAEAQSARAETQLARKDTIALLATDYMVPARSKDKPEEGPVVAARVKRPIAGPGVALIRYTLNGVKKYHEVPRMQTRAPIYGR